LGAGAFAGGVVAAGSLAPGGCDLGAPPVSVLLAAFVALCAATTNSTRRLRW
jgi:hypothetical protein